MTKAKDEQSQQSPSRATSTDKTFNEPGSATKTTNLDSDNDAAAQSQPPKDNLSRRRKTTRRVRNHCAQFYLWWLLGVLIFVAILVPLLYVSPKEFNFKIVKQAC